MSTRRGRWRMGRWGSVLGLLAALLLAAPVAAASPTPGTVWFWGVYPTSGTAACNTPYGDTASPVLIPGLTNVVSVVDVGAPVALRSDGTVWWWIAGRTPTPSLVLRQVPGLSRVVALAAGSDFALALRADGTVWAWGDNAVGQLGNPAVATSTDTPVEVVGLRDVRVIGAGGQTAAATTADGQIWLWGADYGPHGAGEYVVRSTPLALGSLPGVVQLAGGANWMLARLADGSVWGQGNNQFGQLGLAGGRYTYASFTRISPLRQVTAIAAGPFHSLALRADGTVWAWGVGLQGVGEPVAAGPAFTGTPQQVPGLTDVTAVAVAGGASVVLRADGTVWAWGNNTEGELGQGYCSTAPATSPNTPRQVPGLTGVSAIAAMRGVEAYVPVPLALPPLPATAPVRAAPSCTFFAATGHNLCGNFRDYWTARGGLQIFGYPLTEAQPDPVTGLTTQYFERAVFEYHPDAPAGWQVQLQRLGAMVTAGRTDPAFAPLVATSDSSCNYYQETGHRLCNGFRAFWEAHGGVANFGFPISEEFQEKNADTGESYTVQYFERARFEYHPEFKGTPYEVELGRLGAQQLRSGS